MDDVMIQGVRKIANARIRREYPLLDNHFSEADVRIICESLYDLSEKINEAGKGKDMVEWIREHELIKPDENSVTQFYPFYQIEERELEELELDD